MSKAFTTESTEEDFFSSWGVATSIAGAPGKPVTRFEFKVKSVNHGEHGGHEGKSTTLVRTGMGSGNQVLSSRIKSR
jgi:hypothetical protein